jgi:hypothetical protein
VSIHPEYSSWLRRIGVIRRIGVRPLFSHTVVA